MRLLASMTSDVGLETFSPTEPILAVAAAGLLFASNDYQTALDQFIRELVLQDIVMDKDGRLAAFIVLMMARDFAIPSEPEDSTKRLFVDGKNKNIPHPAVKVVKLDKFLQLLLGESLGIKTTSTNSTDSLEEVRNNLLTWASSHYLNFTHFVQFDKHIDEVTSDFLRVCWNRGAAVVCASKQRIYDILLVTYHGDLDGPTDPKKFGLVAIHVKIKASGWDRIPITGLTCPPVMDDLEDEEEEEEVDCWKPEHLVIRMDLGNKIPFEKENERYCDIGYEKAQRPEISRFEQPWRGYLDDEEERYVINVRGHDRGQYPLMDKTGLHEILEMAIPPFQEIAGLWEDSLNRLHFGPSTRSSNPFM
ncbi:hypothetical protein H0H93_011145 [Arthromyces matolae]|nr:hypothetical protein H0H93_011145 [Arthromyces matolae]